MNLVRLSIKPNRSPPGTGSKANWRCSFDATTQSGFLPREAMLARYMLPSCVCLSVGPSVCPSQVEVLPRRLKLESCKQHLTTARDPSFLTPKILAKFHCGHPEEAPNTGYSRRFLTNISLYVTNGARYEHGYCGKLIRTRMALFPVTTSDPNYPKPPPVCTFCIAFQAFISLWWVETVDRLHIW